MDLPGLNGAGSSGSAILRDWMRPAVGLEGTRDALILDLLAPTHPQEARKEVHPESGGKASRVVYAFVDPVSAAVEGRPPGLVRCEWKAHELQALSATSAGEVDLYALIQQIKSPRREPSTGLDQQESTPGDNLRSTAATKLSALGLPTLDIQHLAKDVVQRIDLVPELTSLLLSYYDGQQWHSSWSFSQRRKLPVAVEMRFDLARPASSVEPQPEEDPTVAAQRRLRERNEVPVAMPRPEDEPIRSAQDAAPVGYRWLIYLGGQDDPRESVRLEQAGFARGEAIP